MRSMPAEGVAWVHTDVGTCVPGTDGPERQRKGNRLPGQSQAGWGSNPCSARQGVWEPRLSQPPPMRAGDGGSRGARMTVLLAGMRPGGALCPTSVPLHQDGRCWP